MLIFLIGYMGVGKSSVGRRVARSIELEFVDMDAQIEQFYGGGIAKMFKQRGEEYFRECERELLERILSERDGAIVATGGGLPCFGDNMDRMVEGGVVIYLKASPERIIERLKGRPERRERRPMIAGMDDDELERYVKESLEQRSKIYESADLVVDCDTLSMDQIERRIVEYVESI